MYSRLYLEKILCLMSVHSDIYKNYLLTIFCKEQPFWEIGLNGLVGLN